MQDQWAMIMHWWTCATFFNYLVHAGLEAKFGATTWGKKMQNRKEKASMNDFDRYKAMVAKAARGRRIRKVFNSLKKSAK
jgi:large subunit ribosomal protein L14e